MSSSQIETVCPICLEDLTVVDNTYALCCPSSSCQYNYCCGCIQHLVRSAADDYQEASDGSHHVKVQVACPQCRAKYVAGVSGSSNSSESSVVVTTVLLLRQAATLEQKELGLADSELSASQLASKHEFLQDEAQSVENLRDALDRLHKYLRDIHKMNADGSNRPPDLDWDLWKTVLPEKTPASITLANGTTTSKKLAAQLSTPWRDPTLFGGLEEVITRDEQEFITQWLVSGKPELLSQGALILSGVLQVGLHQNAADTLQQIASLGVASRAPVPYRNIKPKPTDPQILVRIRKRFPLPSRMPLCVRLPVYDPCDPPRTHILRFPQEDRTTAAAAATTPSSSSLAATAKQNQLRHPLELKAVQGPAGRVGLRKGDIVTHVNGDEVTTQTEFFYQLKQQQMEAPGSDTFVITVNSDEKTAQLLKTRAETMQEQKVRFF